jgi:hypothetical protein
MSPNGWTDDFLCMQWFQKSFLPQASARNTSGKPILLIYDGHGSHETHPLRQLAVDNNIILLSLPPHTTHKLQPLDVGVFGPFQRAWADRCDEVVEDTGEEIPREDFVKEYMDVRARTFSANTISQAFKKCGIHPFNSDIFTDHDFAPSMPTSTKGFVPSSFPTGIASTAELEPNGSESDSDSGSDSDYSDSTTSSDKTETEGEEEETSGSELRGDGNSYDHDDNRETNNTHAPDGNIENDNNTNETYNDLQSNVPSPLSTMSISQSCNHTTANGPTQPIQSRTMLLSSAPISKSTRLTRSSSAQMPLYVPLTAPHDLKGLSTQDQIQVLQAENQALRDQVKTLESERDTANAHCAMAASDITDMKQRINLREKKGKKKALLNTDARCLTSVEGMQQSREAEAVREAKAREKREAQERRAAKEAERQAQRAARDPNAPFQGGLNSKSKPDLEAISTALDLTFANTNPKKDDLLKAINSHFSVNPSLRETPRYIGLFTRTRGQKRRAPASDENFPPADQQPPSLRRRLKIPSANTHAVPAFQPSSQITSSSSIAGPSVLQPLIPVSHLQYTSSPGLSFPTSTYPYNSSTSNNGSRNPNPPYYKLPSSSSNPVPYYHPHIQHQGPHSTHPYLPQ